MTGPVQVEPEQAHGASADLIADFRYWSFQVYYHRSFANEQDLTLRFIKALIASAAPIRDMQKVIEWATSGKRRTVRTGPIRRLDEEEACQ